MEKHLPGISSLPSFSLGFLTDDSISIAEAADFCNRIAVIFEISKTKIEDRIKNVIETYR